jgi:hypothetical protein
VTRVRRRDQNQYWCMTRGYIYYGCCSARMCLYTIYCLGRLCKWTNKRRARERQLWRIDFAAAINFNLRALWPLAAAWVMNCGLFNELLRPAAGQPARWSPRPTTRMCVCVHAALHGQINFSPLFSINFTEVGIIVLLRHTNGTTELKLSLYSTRGW